MLARLTVIASISRLRSVPVRRIASAVRSLRSSDRRLASQSAFLSSSAAMSSPIPFSTAPPAWVPAGYHSLTPNLNIAGGRALEAISWYERALQAVKASVHLDSSKSVVMHAELRIADSVLFVNDVHEAWGGDWSAATHSSFYLYVDDVDASYNAAVKAGAQGKSEPKDQFWGDRTGCVVDPFGQRWTFSRSIPGFVRHPPVD